ncbi:amidohydrolase family protein [Glycomyces sp. TRM65418]|uniref:amidohydrolase family protein n=1 Tax=Glycomyces sp. TRM65418 TaxID=2867006 RepID=UPI001CE50A8C|nr:amidohydrolase family protein [Glycomyces sp. TRM65418]MCC3761595.1 amidohydrolase family protein [Glycomyces sp. TRM65418]QZD55691.1 amidohydrolase family protein [Glycomyces sp. TRM65418]
MNSPPAAGPVLDFHARLTPRPGALDDLLASMAASGVAAAGLAAGGVLDLETLARQVALGGASTADADNAAVLAASRSSQGRLVPIYFANPHAGPEPYQEAADDFAALEISPAVHGFDFDDPRVEELVAIARDSGHAVYTVCLPRPGTGVADLADLAARFPDVDFVLGHGGVSLIDLHAISVIADHPNIALETCGPYAAVVRLALERLGPRRLVFAAEHPLQPVRAELAKFAGLDLSADTWNSVAWHNGRRLLGIEES